MVFAILRGANGRRHEVNIGDDPVEVNIHVSSEVVQITVEATHDLAPSDKRRFATMTVPREKFAAALGENLQSFRRKSSAG